MYRPDFQLYLKTLMTNATLNDVKLSHVRLLEKAELHYCTLIISKKWDSAGTIHGSSFHAQQQHRAQRTNDASTTKTSNRPPRYNMPTWHRTAPNDSKPHERTFEDKLFKWCGVCQCWFSGDRAHLTHKHVQGHSSRRPVRAAPTATVATTPSTNATIIAAATPAAPTPPVASITYLFTGGL